MSSFLEATGPALEQAWAWFVVVGTLVLVAAAWRVLGTLARRHKDADPRAGTKRLVALGCAVLLGAGGWVALSGFEASAKEGLHKTFVGNLNLTTGEGDYLDAAKTVAAKPAAIVKQQQGLADANATLAATPDAASLKARNELWSALNQSRKDLTAGQATMAKLTPNHALWQQALPLLGAHKDAEARALFDAALAAGVEHSYRDTHTLQDVAMKDAIPEAYAHLAEFGEQMTTQMRWFVYPNLTGLVLAPFAFAGGSTLGRAFVPSETVGFKRYPGKAAGFFLLLGAGGVFAIPFGAWLLRDFAKRSKEGQIQL
jgi:hypothetical protein